VERSGVGKALQAKLTESVTELVDARTSELMTEVRALRKELAETREQLAEAVRMFEVRHRRDMIFAGEARAARESEQFIADHLVHARPLPHPVETVRYAASLVKIDGTVVKVGVHSGEGLLLLAERLHGREIYGFDTFTGLEHDWRPGYTAGMLGQDEPPKVRGATVVPGAYDETLPAFRAEHPGPIALLHLDANEYSVTAKALELLGDGLVPGSVVLLDEYVNYPGWQEHEFRAWTEFVERSGIEFRYEAYTFDNEQVVVTVTATGKAG
jgi:hypothetical protein